MSQKIIFTCTWGAEEPERATLPFVAANVAALAGQDAVVLCTVEAVRLGVEGGAKDVAAQGFPPLAELYRDYVAAGGKVWLCGACTKPRGITDLGLAPGTTIVGAAMVVEEIVGGCAYRRVCLNRTPFSGSDRTTSGRVPDPVVTREPPSPR